MRKKILIILFFLAAAGARHALPLQGLAFAATQENGQPCPPECVTDSMEIVTWYPSPYNEYEELRLYPVQREDNYCTNDKIGLMYYDDGGTPSFGDDDKMRVCKGTLLGWQEVGGGFWQQLTGNDISNANSGTVSINKLKIPTNAQAGYILTSDASGNAEWQASSGNFFANKKIFDTVGTFTFTIPAGMTQIMVEVWGGGGGGGAAGRSGGPGGEGGAGGRSSFGNAIYATGGQGGGSGGPVGCGPYDGSPGGSGGVSNATINYPGDKGGNGSSLTPSVGPWVYTGDSGGRGGDSFGDIGSGGAGGSGDYCARSGGGGGGGGYGRETVTVAPKSTYAIIVGSGGNSSSGGVKGNNGKVIIYY